LDWFKQLEEEDCIIAKWTQEDVETSYNLLNNNNNNNNNKTRINEKPQDDGVITLWAKAWSLSFTEWVKGFHDLLTRTVYVAGEHLSFHRFTDKAI
jgi:hypothetical protein